MMGTFGYLPRIILLSTTTVTIMNQSPILPSSYGSTSPTPRSTRYSGVSYHDPGSSTGLYNQPADDFKVGPPFHLFDAFSGPLDSMWSMLRKAPLGSDLRLFFWK